MTDARLETRELKVFLSGYETYVREVLQPTQVEITRLLRGWERPEYWGRYTSAKNVPVPTPIRSSFCRIKRPEQVVDKILRKPEQFPNGLTPDSYERMHDAIGVRVVVYFLRHLPLIDRDLRNSDVIEISDLERSVAYMTAQQARILSLDHLAQEQKESGYQSVHYNVRMKLSSIAEDKRPVFELQVRTAAQDLWSTLEHHLGYKPTKRTGSMAKAQLRILSAMLRAIDDNFNLLYEELNRPHAGREYSAHDELTAEVIPAVLAEVGLSCNQRDINNILTLLFSRGVRTVGQLVELADPSRLEIIRNTYISVAGRDPVSLEVVATLAAMHGAADEDEAIRLQIDYLGATDSIRRESRIEGM
jgi:ppGpp synthetase/RelA/SpoT-type nucleotidyltranferase